MMTAVCPPAYTYSATAIAVTPAPVMTRQPNSVCSVVPRVNRLMPMYPMM